MLKRDINPSLEELRLYSMPPTPNAEEPSRNIFSAQLRSRTSLESGEVRTRLDRMLSDPNESLLFGSFRRSSSRQRIGLFGREACFEGGDISNVDEFIAFDRAKRRNGRDDELISLSDGEVLEEMPSEFRSPVAITLALFPSAEIWTTPCFPDAV